jgi:hypothetical protein
MFLNPRLRTASLLATIATTLLMDTSGASAQQIEWAQTVNLPKGANLPQGVSADILGIELGESYASAKPKMERLYNDSPASDFSKTLNEGDRTLRSGMPGAAALTVTHPALIQLMTIVPGAGKGHIRETLSVYFSAPSSGAQVVGISRSIAYPDHADQPRIADLIERLKERLKSAPQIYPERQHVQYRFVFHQGRVADPSKQNSATCNADYGIPTVPVSASDVPNWNRERACDVTLRLEIVYGVSKDHVGRINFLLSDNERAKQNFMADYAFFEGYVKRIQDKTKGAVPKL